jgi:predicted HicB family RNase H-like nuclease
MAPKSKRVLPGKRYPLNMRTTKELRDKIESAATVSGRSLVQEVEIRLERSFQEEEIEKSTGTVKLQVRLSERLHGRLEEAAKQKGQSINTEIWDRLNVSLELENREKMIEKTASDGVQGLQKFEEEMIERVAKRAARDAVQAQQEETRNLLAELSKSKDESPPKGEDPK